MKKLIYSIVLLVSMTSLTYAQEAESIAKSNGKVELVQSKTTGVYQFSFATDRTAESVEKAASYYTSNFTVDFDEASNTATINLVENNVTSRTVIARFLAVNQVKFIEIDGMNVEMYVFIESYLK
jgi:hypothetical protein